MLASSTCRAQQPDPYANEFRQQQIQHQSEQRTKLMETMKVIYFASICSVFKTAIGPTAINSMMAAQFQLNMPANQFLALEKEAKAVALARKSSGGCDYWHQHPEEIYRLRQLEWNAVQYQYYR
jgi:hypothetical protein